MKEMKAVIFSDVGKHKVVMKPIPKIAEADQMLVKVKAASICGSDVHVLNNPPSIEAKLGVVLGHEFVGKVVEIGEGVRHFEVGDRIICDPNIPCGHCKLCQMGHPNLCKNMVTIGIDIDGGFAEYVIVPEKVALKIPDTLSVEKAIFAEPLNCVMGAIKQIKLFPSETVLVLGAGPIGLYFTSLLKSSGAGKVIVSEVSDYRKSFAKKMGADIIVDPRTDRLVETVMMETDGYGADIVVDTVGILLNDSLKCIRPAGRIMLFGANKSATQTICQTDITWHGISVLGNFIGNFTLDATASLLQSDIVDFESLITHRISLDEFDEGLNAMRDGTAIEVVVFPDKTTG